MSEDKENDSMVQLIGILILLTITIASGSFLPLMVVHQETSSVTEPTFTLENPQTLDESSVINILTNQKGLDSQQRVVLKNRLAELSSAANTSCSECNKNVKKLLQDNEDAKSENKKATDAMKRKSNWVFSITLIGTLLVLGLKMKKALKEKSKTKRHNEMLLLVTEWFFPVIVLIITIP